MSGVELQEHQGKSVEQNSVSDETRLDNKLKELGDLEKEIFSGDGLVDGQSSDTTIDESYKQGLDHAKTIQQKIDFIESLVLEFQHERKLQELFQTQEKSWYRNEEGKENLNEWKGKIQSLFNKYPELKSGIVEYFQVKFEHGNFLVEYHDDGMGYSSIEEKQKVTAAIFDYNVFSDFDKFENTIEYIQKNTSIENKNMFLNHILTWNPDEIYNIGEKMDVISQLNFHQKEGGYKYALSSMTSRGDFYLSALLTIDVQKLQKLDTFFQKGDDEGFDNYIKNSFSASEITNLLGHPAIEKKYIQIQRLHMNLQENMLSDNTILSLAKIKNKNIEAEFQQIISDITHAKTIGNKIDLLSDAIDDNLGVGLKKSVYLSDSHQIIDIVGRLIVDFSSGLKEGTQEYKKMETLYKKTNAQIQNVKSDTYKKTFDYISERILYLKGIGDTESITLLQKIEKIEKIDSNQIEDKKSDNHDTYSNSGDISLPTDKLLPKLLLIEDDMSRRGVEKTGVLPKPTPTPNPETSSAKIPEMQKSLSRLGLNVKVSENGSIVGVNGETNFTQKIGNRTFEINDNGQIITQGAFGYNFKYENNLNGIEQYLEIADQIEYVDDMGLGHFGENLKEMISILNIYTSYTGLKYINIDDTTINSTNFINQVELTNISKAFHKIGFLSNENFSYSFKNGEMQKVEFTHIMETKFEGKNFFKGGSFDREMFKKTVTETQWQK